MNVISVNLLEAIKLQTRFLWLQSVASIRKHNFFLCWLYIPLQAEVETIYRNDGLFQIFFLI